MKKILILSGGVVVLAIVAFLFYLSLEFHDQIYFLFHRQEIIDKLAERAEKTEKDAAAQAQARTEQTATSIREHPSFFVDPDGDKTEDNWIASNLASDIAAMAYAIIHPGQPLPDFSAKAQVDPDKPAVHVVIGDFGNHTPVTADLTPAFAWDGPGYAPLAQQLLGITVPVMASNANSPNILATLQDLTAPNLAREDLRLSGNLQANPASWRDHEAGALALTALALRECDGNFYDIRDLLTRAAAHLAVAQSLRGSQPASWPGLVADAAVRTLAGREVDAIGHIDTLEARADCPESAKPWLKSLRMLAKRDWRIAQPNADSPLLQKIVWFQVLARNIRGTTATGRLEKILPPPPDDPTAASSVWALTDWGRAVMNGGLQVDTGHQFTETNITLEYQELNQVLAVEGGDPVTEQNLTATFAEPEDKTVAQDGDGKTVFHVIGRGTFKAASRRHLYFTIVSTFAWMNTYLGIPQDAADFRTKMDQLFKDVPLWPLAENGIAGFSGNPEDIQRKYAQWTAEKRSWKLWEADPIMSIGLPGSDLVRAFYQRGVPFGTVYDIDQRISMVNLVGRRDWTAELSEARAKADALPLDQAQFAFSRYFKPLNDKIAAAEPKSPTAYDQQLLKLDPDSYTLVTANVPIDKLPPVIQPFLDYNLRAVEKVVLQYRDKIDDATHETMWRKDAALDPNAYFGLADFLREEGKDDEAAAMDRKGVAEADDAVLMANSVGSLVTYDLAHGLKDEAVAVAQNAADTGSEGGMEAQMTVDEAQGKLDDAEAVANEIKERYGSDDELTWLYAAHQDHFPAKYEEIEKRVFPDGLTRAGFGSFAETPHDGCQIVGPEIPVKSSGLQLHDVIVALNGYRIGSMAQYDFVRALGTDPTMDFVIWRGGKFQEIKSTLPDRRFHSDLADYHSFP